MPLKKFPHFKQLDQMDCGPTCLRMVAKFYGRSYSTSELRNKSFITREGVSLLGISDAAEAIGFRTIGVKIPFNKLVDEALLPCIVHWYQRHFVVVYKITKTNVFVADPAAGLITFTKEEFKKGWHSTKDNGRGCKVNCVKVGQTLTLTHNEKRRAIQFRGNQEESPGAVPLG